MSKTKLTCKGRRITQNRYLLGPEYLGCCNTGQRPKLVRCGFSNRYIVGCEADVDSMRVTILRAVKDGDTGVKFRVGDNFVWVYKSRTSAGAKFDELCAGVVGFNEREHNRG